MKAPKIKLYGFVRHDRSGKVSWLLEELGLPYEFIPLDYEKNENTSSSHLARNPMGAVPVLEIDDLVMHESDAIVWFLAEKFGKFIPEMGSKERAHCLQWMHFCDGTLGYAKIARFPYLSLPEYTADEKTSDGKSALEVYREYKKESEDEFQKVLGVLEAHLTGRPYLCRDFSVADISLAYSLSWTEKRGDLKNYPVLTAYLAKNKIREAAVKAKTFG